MTALADLTCRPTSQVRAAYDALAPRYAAAAAEIEARQPGAPIALLATDAYGIDTRTWATVVRRTRITLVVDVTGMQLAYRRSRGRWVGTTPNARGYAVDGAT